MPAHDARAEATAFSTVYRDSNSSGASNLPSRISAGFTRDPYISWFFFLSMLTLPPAQFGWHQRECKVPGNEWSHEKAKRIKAGFLDGYDLSWSLQADYNNRLVSVYGRDMLRLTTGPHQTLEVHGRCCQMSRTKHDF